MKSKQGYDIKSLAGLGVAFVVIAIVLSFGATILSDLAADQTAGTYERNATNSGLESLEEFSSWLPTLALIVVAAVIIGVIVTYFAMRA